MSTFKGQICIITGGASGIGRAVAARIVALEGTVVLVDNNAQLVEQTAAELGERASARNVDVREADAVQQVVQDTVAKYGRLDLMFNNAGIGIVGEVAHFDLLDWNRTLDINVRGVVHGVVAAYPVMIEQGFGHIVSTASLAGLTPSPGLAAYAAAKHAVVGLSTSLRAEAVRHGVKVSVVCPGLIDTPLVHGIETRNIDRERALNALPVPLTAVDACARRIVDGIVRNQATIMVTGHARILTFLYRLFPALYSWILGHQTDRVRRLVTD